MTLWDGPRWEYAQAAGPPDPQQLHACCVQMGRQGWELCSSITVNAVQPGLGTNGMLQQQLIPTVILEFKRPAQPTVES